jgi:hypothetical protein
VIAFTLRYLHKPGPGAVEGLPGDLVRGQPPAYLRRGRQAPHGPLTFPDDITALGRDLFTAFENGVGPQGQPATTGNQDSTVVEFTPGGHVVRQWDIVGKCDGLTADPATHEVIATVNEDANSSVYTIDPWASPAAQVRH